MDNTEPNPKIMKLYPMDAYTKSSHEPPLIQDLAASSNIEEKDDDDDGKCLHFIETSALADYRLDDSKIKEIEKTRGQNVNSDGIEIFKEVSSSEGHDLKDIVEQDENQLLIPPTKHESVESHDADSKTLGLGTSLEDQDSEKSEDFEATSGNKNLMEQDENQLSIPPTKHESVESHDADSMTLGLGTSLEDQDSEKPEDFEATSGNKNLMEQDENQLSIPTSKHESVETHDADSMALDLESSFEDQDCEKSEDFEGTSGNKNLIIRENLFCDICAHTFRHLKSLIHHIKTKHGIKNPLICKVCGRKFECKDTLECHEKKGHLKTKTYQCNLCSRSFEYKKNLNTHISNAHLKNGKHQCDLCQRKFAYKSELNIHSKSHTSGGEMCDICNRSFRFLRAHIYNEHRETLSIKYKCKQCDETSSTKLDFKEHITTHFNVPTSNKRRTC